MKQNKSWALCLAVCLGVSVALPVFGDDQDVEYTAYVVASLGSTNKDKWVVDGVEYDSDAFVWDVRGSEFKHAGYPQKKDAIPAWPQKLFGDSPVEKPTSFGVRGQFDRQGYNWIDIYPTKDGVPADLPLPGRVSSINIWAWGENLRYTIEGYVKDYKGTVHVIPLGSLAFAGWGNLRARIPDTIRQTKRVSPNLANLRFVKFRIWTEPTEQVKDFQVYLNQFKVLSDVYETFFDGNDLARPETVQRLWESDANANDQ
ncbi:MAG: flagellar filament outer layer protein FlaA [Treponema sp.]|jgi:hypothetical protein|nr:flagellar filament outer layer protein FlaA [Treponema sp.]